MVIGIMGAMQEEITPLLEHYKNYEAIDFGGNTFYRVLLPKKQLIIARSRVGKVHSALTASVMVLHFGCKMIIFNGVAGGVNPQYRIGDLVLGTQLCQHDVDITIFGHPFGYFSDGQRFYQTNPALRELAKRFAKEILGQSGISLHEGVIATGDQFVSSKERKEWIQKEFKADAIEMEGASVAVVCSDLEIPLCVIRAISDDASDEAVVSYEEFLESSARLSSSLVVKMIENL